MSDYLLLGRRLSAADEGFAAAMATAHAERHRPLCLCIEDCTEPPEMYVARLRHGFVLKRMPFTGGRHAPDCPSYEPPEDWSGLGQVMGSAIQEDPLSGVTALKLDFALSKTGSRVIPAGGGEAGDSVASDGTRLSLRGLLHYLWDEAQLTHWKPGFAGKRSWGTVRRHLMQAADGKIVSRQPLGARLYIPEVFSVEQRDAINARRRACWARAAQASPGGRQLMLLIGEVKEVVPARYGCKAVIRHVPDQAFALDDGLYRRMAKSFERELSLWGASEYLRMVMAATFGINGAGVPTIEELTLMPVLPQWLPVKTAAEKQLIERLVDEGRSFRKTLRYNLRDKEAIASAVVTDVAGEPVALHIGGGGRTRTGVSTDGGDGAAAITDDRRDWFWDVAEGPMPAPPPRVIGQPRASASHA